MGEVKGMKAAELQASEGMKLFAKDDAIEGDVEAATAFKDSHEAKMAELEKEAAALPGKENKKARSEKEKERMNMKNEKQYIDALKVVKGGAPVHGFFIKSGGAQPKPKEESAPAAAPAAAAPEEKKSEKDKKSAKKTESAGISREERVELESLKTKIIDKKTALKAEGLSGGQINKNEEVVAWVARMNELKEKESPGSTSGGKDDKKGGGGKKKKVLDSESVALLEAKQKAFDEYTDRLRTEFKYSKKEIAADPEYQEMKAELEKLNK